MHQNKQITHKKQNLSKTEQSGTLEYFWNSKNPTKIGSPGQFMSIDLHQKESTQKHVSVNY